MKTNQTSTGVFVIVLCIFSSLLTTLQATTVGTCRNPDSTITKTGCAVFYLINCVLSLLCILKTFGVFHIF